MYKFSIVNFFFLLLSGVDAARILGFFPTPSISHQIVFRSITHELVKRGHEVTVITPDPVYPKGKAPKNLTEIDVHHVSYNNWKGLFMNHKGNKDDLMMQVKGIFKSFADIADLQLESIEVKEVLNKDKKYFDILLLESCVRPILGVATLFDAPIIQISSFGIASFQYSDLGAPIHPILYPMPGRQRLYNLTLLERAIEYFKHVMFEYLIHVTEAYDYAVMQKHFGKEVPSFPELRRNIQMMFVNEHPIWADNHPVPPNILYMGGSIHKALVGHISEDLQNFMDSSQNGVIYISFGTNVLTTLLPEEKIVIITNVLSELPYDILWKWDGDNLPGRYKNIKISKWFPQVQLLNHPKLKLFITQGGLQSTEETIDAGVPVIGVPMLGDQWYNVEKYIYHKIGLQLDIQSLTEDEFKTSINTVINDPSFKSNIIKLRSLMRSFPIKPLDQAIWWVEHVIQFGGKHLQPPSAFVHWIEYFEIKLIGLILTFLSVLLMFLWLIVKLIWKFICTWIIKFKVKVQ